MRAAAALIVLCACSPQQVAEDVTQAAARSVIVAALSPTLPAAQTEVAATCLAENASAAELGALARDVGTRAGTSTLQNVGAIAARPATVACLAGRGVGPVLL